MLISFGKIAAAQNDLAACNSDDVERIISGCTAIIDGGSLSGSTLAIAYSRRSDALVAQSKLEEAIADRKKARELDPASETYERRLLELYELRGDTRLVAGEFTAAIEDYSIVLDGGLLTTALFEKRSEAHVGGGDIAKAIVDLKAAVDLATDKNALFERIALLHELEAAKAHERKDLDTVISSYRSAIEQLGSLNSACAENKEADDSSSFDTACASGHRVERALVAALIDRARTRLRSGKVKAAKEDLKSALSRDSKNTEAQLLHALASEQLDDFSMARVMYRQALRTDPSNKEARDGLERLDQRERNLARALQIELKRIGCDPGPIDGLWGRKSRSAVEEFNKTTNNNLGVYNPNKNSIEVLSRHREKVCIPLFVGVWDCGDYGRNKFTEYTATIGEFAITIDTYEKDGDDYILYLGEVSEQLSLIDVTKRTLLWHSLESGDTFECRRTE